MPRTIPDSRYRSVLRRSVNAPWAPGVDATDPTLPHPQRDQLNRLAGETCDDARDGAGLETLPPAA